jgi:hypothetical protein
MGRGRSPEVRGVLGRRTSTFVHRSKRHTSKQLGRSVPPNNNSADRSVGVEVEKSSVARQINCVSNDGSDRSL